VLVFATDSNAAHTERAVASGVHGWVVNGHGAQHLRPLMQLAQARFQCEQALLEALRDGSSLFVERKAVERAKGILKSARQVSDDAALCFGFGFRGAALGPMAQKAMSGWNTHLTSGASVYPIRSNISSPPACVAHLVQQGRTGMKSGAGCAERTPEQAADFKRKYVLRLRAGLEVLGVAPD
jgi:hypothetical protein